MAYEEDDREVELDEHSNFFEDDPAYGADTYFGERLETPQDDLDEVDDDMADEDIADEEVATRPDVSHVESDFGERIKTESGDESTTVESYETDIDDMPDELED